ncbi:hypothetical protein [Dokdonella ginsengisoli]|uniref:PNPLA domain-containing protein n=1 Tax=Dokdonella ginsengisoli TaxID=363846 RepID=A0ABV9QYU4_9GAMM
MSANHPRPECDVVLKGGITSGVVYPLALARLASHYVLRSLGGASAGAIAAAAAAAAEYGRAQGGFERLAELPEQLAATDAAGATHLFRLFQPQASTRRLYRLLVAGLMPERPHWGLAIWRWLCAAVTSFPFAALTAAVFSVALLWALDVRSGEGTFWIACVAALFTAALVFVVALALSIVLYALRRVSANGYGLCSGLGEADALTPWLHATLQSLAGLDPSRPLRFGDLWCGPVADPGYRVDAATSDAQQRFVDLRLMTTALNHGRPYSFPLADESFCFDADEMRRLFPAVIVDAMIADSPGRYTDGPLAGRYRLPAMADLPVLVPLRMSLAFPLLLSAVPLWRLRVEPRPRRRGAWRRVAEKVWFSDGGICSNFPIHYFDVLVPSRPSFAIDLVDGRYLPAQAEDPRDFVWMPEHNGSGGGTRVVDVDAGSRPRLSGFLRAIVVTMQGWGDGMQLPIPGYRDRIVAVRLRADEGGMNLRMSPELIRRLARRGERAAELLLEHYAAEAPPRGSVTGWRNHRWVRYRVAMRLLGKALEELRQVEAATAESAAALQPMHADPPSYDFRSERQRAAALAAYRELLALAQRYADEAAELGYPIFEHDPYDGPRPRALLSIRPPL